MEEAIIKKIILKRRLVLAALLVQQNKRRRSDVECSPPNLQEAVRKVKESLVPEKNRFSGKPSSTVGNAVPDYSDSDVQCSPPELREAAKKVTDSLLLEKNRFREPAGDGEKVITELRISDEDHFFNYTRLNLRQFDLLLSLVKTKLTKSNNCRKSISPEIRLTLTLRHLASGDPLSSLASAFSLGKSTACMIIKGTCDVLWETLSPLYLKVPTANDWLQIAKDFEVKFDVPHCLGVIDGKHVVIQTPHTPNHKSLVLFAICDSNYVFRYIDIGTYGAESDGGLLRESVMGRKLLTGELNVPKDDNLKGTNKKFPYYFVGDEAFPLNKYLLRPFATSADKEKIVFNNKLSKVHRCIENSFGILVSRFRVFHKVINALPETVESVVKATICLHNFIRSDNESNKYCPPTYIDTYDSEGTMIPGDWRSNIPKNPALEAARNLRRRIGARNATREAEANRDTLKDYLNRSAVKTVPKT